MSDKDEMNRTAVVQWPGPVYGGSIPPRRF
jgi:hypothetical protein